MNREPPIAVLSMACRFPDAETPEALWQNVLDGRRSFRSIPAQRLPLDDYVASTVGSSLSITPILAGLLTDWKFDRARFRVPQTAYAAADLAHWLALDVAANALDRIGGAERLARERTAVVLGNTLTGEFSRTGQIPLRLPYLLEKVANALAQEDLPRDAIETITDRFRRDILSDFSEPNEETLAGGLANTIAGRIANQFDLRGGAWTVDGACASSLLAVCDACTRLGDGSADVVIAGGVDLSLDPFELVGFSRNGALAADQMRVFDRRAQGFWPGEGCGIVVLANSRAVKALDVEPIAYIAGFGVSTDGAGGLTRPTREGQVAALRKAYQRAAVEPGSLGYVEAHGTGTAIGDPTEIRALAELAGAVARPIPVGSIKANIGHTKAAAGVAGLIKAVCAVRDGIVPPHVGCQEPHPVFADTNHRLKPALDTDGWHGIEPRHAGVSGFGFGGVNAHLVVTGTDAASAKPAPPTPVPQDAELFVFSGHSPQALADELRSLHDAADTMSLAGLSDAAAYQASRCDRTAPYRAALVVSRPDELKRKLEGALKRLDGGDLPGAFEEGVDVSCVHEAPRVGFLFPGQGAPVRATGGVWRRRFDESKRLLAEMPTGAQDGDVSTQYAQPGIVGASCAAIDVLTRLGIEAHVAVGHSLGELSALSWGGALPARDAVRLAGLRGKVMSDGAAQDGAMARVADSADALASIARDFGLEIACENGNSETVLAGRAGAVDRCVEALAAAGIEASRLAVSHAFHTADMAPAATVFEGALDGFAFAGPQYRVISTVTGDRISPDADIRALLLDQFVSPVRFNGALKAAAAECDFFLEVGPGSGLTRLARAAGYKAASVDAHGSSLKGLLDAAALAFLSGVPIDAAQLFEGRSTRAFDPAYRPVLLANPCGRTGDRNDQVIPQLVRSTLPGSHKDEPRPVAVSDLVPPRPGSRPADPDLSTLDVVLNHFADELALPVESLTPQLRFLDDLHLNSLAVGRVVAEIAHALKVRPPAALSDFANASLGELADALTELKMLGEVEQARPDRFEGVASWIERFRFEWETARAPDGAQDITWHEFGADRVRADGQTIRSGAGAVLTIAEWDGMEALERIWDMTQACREAGYRHIAFVHSGAPVSAFARSLHEENVFATTCVVELSGDRPADSRVQALLETVEPGFSEWRIGADGALLRPVFRRQARKAGKRPLAWCADDVVVVTGGARGIGAECALRLAERTGTRLLLLGRSPATQDDVCATMKRAGAAGVDAVYQSVDVTEAKEVTAALEKAQERFGHPVTGILHAAGINHPQLFPDVSRSGFRETLAVKIQGLEGLLSAVDPARLKAVIGFGSIIGRLGLAGETHYALANAAQSALLEDYAARNPQIHVAAPEWSVWAGAGMGERLGTLDRLAETGVEALSLGDALDVFEVLATEADDGPQQPAATVVTGRFGPPQTVDLACPPLDLHRFLESVRVHYPGIELVADARIGRGTDPYLVDHEIDGQMVLPGVIILEAMTAAARSLAVGDDADAGISVERLRFEKPVLVPEGNDLTVRVAALRRPDGSISCLLRTSADGFAAAHASADIRFGRDAVPASDLRFARPEHPGIEAADFYGPLFFNRGRFAAVQAYSRLSAREVTATLGLDGSKPWFGSFLPQTLLLGDPARRDGGLHALQAAVPQRRVIPASVERIVIHDPVTPRHAVAARQVAATDTSFEFDIAFFAEDGRCLESWQGATFKAVGEIEAEGLPDALFTPWLEREIMFATGLENVRVARADGAERAVRRAAAAAACGLPAVRHRGDGRPLLSRAGDTWQLSVSHHGQTTLVVAAESSVGCDMETAGILPAAAIDGGIDRWCVREALRKCGIAAPSWAATPHGAAGGGNGHAPVPDKASVAGHTVIVRTWRDGLTVAVALGQAPADGPRKTAAHDALWSGHDTGQRDASFLNEFCHDRSNRAQ